MKILKNGNIIYRRGWKTLVANFDGKVDDEIFEAEASFFQTVNLLFLSDILINIITIFLILSTSIFLLIVFVREFRIYIAFAIRVVIAGMIFFFCLILYRSHFWKFFWK